MGIPSDPDTDPYAGDVRRSVRKFMEEHWREPGFTCPNADTYPWLWLWDSCFHSLIWASLGDEDRAIDELRTALSHQHPSGFVPHVTYFDGFEGHRDFWRTQGTSSITQPPIYGHTIAGLKRLGLSVPEELIEQAERGLEFLLNTRRRTSGGLVEMVHPWESGCDHSPRWDDLFVGGSAESRATNLDPYDQELWFRRKGEMVESINLVDGAPISADDCSVGSVAFNALIAFCAFELVDVTGDESLSADATELSRSLADRWNSELSTWVDDGPTEGGSGAARTLEGLLPILVDPRAEVVDEVRRLLLDKSAFAGRFGLRQVDPAEPTFDSSGYWRGASWPQLNYLFEVALKRSGLVDSAHGLAVTARAGAVRSGYSEHWDADDGTGGGARPQSWTGLVLVDADVTASTLNVLKVVK